MLKSYDLNRNRDRYQPLVIFLLPPNLLYKLEKLSFLKTEVKRDAHLPDTTIMPLLSSCALPVMFFHFFEVRMKREQ